jgi:AhpD family alkylhydroperoxidase
MTAAAPRLAPGGLRDIGAVNWVVCRALSFAAGVPDVHLFSTLARHRRLFRAWLRFAGALMPGGTLPRRETEAVILRVSHVRGCRYEHEHHVALARRAGLSDEEIGRVAAGPAAFREGTRERALLAATDELLARRELEDGTWDALRAHLTEAEAIEACLLVGHYDMLAMTIGALRVAPDASPRRRRPG